MPLPLPTGPPRLRARLTSLPRPEWITYDQWGAFLPEAPDGYQMSIGADNFVKILRTYGGQEAVDDWEKLARTLRPMSAGIKGIPHASIRNDAGIFLTVGAKYPLSFLNILGNVGLFTESFNLDDLGLKSPFLRNYLNMLGASLFPSFALCFPFLCFPTLDCVVHLLDSIFTPGFAR